jgi:hypothetical protein
VICVLKRQHLTTCRSFGEVDGQKCGKAEIDHFRSR